MEGHTQHQASPGQYKAAGWDTGIKFPYKERMTGFRRCYLINELLKNGTWLENAVTLDKSLNCMSFPHHSFLSPRLPGHMSDVALL